MASQQAEWLLDQIFPIDWPVATDAILNFDGHREGDDVDTCKQIFVQNFLDLFPVKSTDMLHL